MNNPNFEVSLLIRADYYWSIVEDKIIRGNGPTAMKYKLGYLLSGPLSTPLPTGENLHTFVREFGHCDISRFWDLESTGTLHTNEPASENEFLASYLKSSVSCQPGRSYKVKFPWKSNHPPLSSNRGVCERQAKSLAWKLSRTPNLLKTFGEIISNQAQHGFIENVTESQIPLNCHFIPHHPVKKDSATTPIRIVYDCSCRQSSSHPSLNDYL